MKVRRTEGRSQKSEGRRRAFNLWTLTNVNLRRTFLLSALMITIVLFSVAFAVEGDIVFKRADGGSTPPAVFPHWVHRIRYKCYACHPEPFQMKAGANKITMEAIQQGKFCGLCHNETVAWGITFGTCNRCHIGK